MTTSPAGGVQMLVAASKKPPWWGWRRGLGRFRRRHGRELEGLCASTKQCQCNQNRNFSV